MSIFTSLRNTLFGPKSFEEEVAEYYAAAMTGRPHKPGPRVTEYIRRCEEYGRQKATTAELKKRAEEEQQ